MNHELHDVQAGFKKGRGTRDQTTNIHCIIKKARNLKNIYFCYSDYAKAFDCVTVENSQRDGNTRQPNLPHEKPVCMQVRKQQLELEWNNRLVPNRKKSTSRLCIVNVFI